MRGLQIILIAAGLLLFVYAVIGRFVGPATLGFCRFIPTANATAVILVANTLLLLAVILKIYEKK